MPLQSPDNLVFQICGLTPCVLSKMTLRIGKRAIYSGAYLIIVADHAKSGKEGCFAPSVNKPFLMTRNTLPKHFQLRGKAYIEWNLEFDLHPYHNQFINPQRFIDPQLSLSSRAWTLQERLLSRRTIHYTSGELVWECRQDLHCQCGRILSNDTIMQRFHSSIHSGARFVGVMDAYSPKLL